MSCASVNVPEEISEQTARTALHALPEMIDHRYSHTGRLAARAWDLRHTITFYDALYVALAAVLDMPLLTADVRLSKAPGLSCRVMLIN
jgi:predicted nucleic acid-binding protein